MIKCLFAENTCLLMHNIILMHLTQCKKLALCVKTFNRKNGNNFDENFLDLAEFSAHAYSEFFLKSLLIENYWQLLTEFIVLVLVTIIMIILTI